MVYPGYLGASQWHMADPRYAARRWCHL